jgi:hypothetical protein
LNKVSGTKIILVCKPFEFASASTQSGKQNFYGLWNKGVIKRIQLYVLMGGVQELKG